MSGVHNELAPAEDPGARGNEGSAELEENVEEVEEVGEGAVVGDADGGFVFGGHASHFTDVGEVEIERIDEERDEASYEEKMVPPVDNVAAGVQNLVAP